MKAQRFIIKLLLCLAIVSVSSLCADDKKPASGNDDGYVTEKKGNTTIKYKKKTTYDFEGASIDGVYNKPSGSYISNIKDVKAKSIIRIRENFDAEVIDSARQLK